MLEIERKLQYKSARYLSFLQKLLFKVTLAQSPTRVVSALQHQMRSGI